MLIKNLDEQLVNGSMGRVTSFEDPDSYAESRGMVPPTSRGPPNSMSGAAAMKKSSTATVAGREKFPVVEFLLPSGEKKEILVTSESFRVEAPNGEIQVNRSQVRCRI